MEKHSVLRHKHDLNITYNVIYSIEQTVMLRCWKSAALLLVDLNTLLCKPVYNIVNLVLSNFVRHHRITINTYHPF